MKAALFSLNISNEAAVQIEKMSGKSMSIIRVCFITTAANVYDKENSEWFINTQSRLNELYGSVTELDIEQKGKEFDYRDFFQKFNIIFIGGGNTFYLNYWMKLTEAENALKDLVLNEEVVYAGSSAGSIYATDDISVYEKMDDTTKIPTVINNGMGLFDFGVLVHWGRDKYKNKLEQIKNYYQQNNTEIYTLTDEDALIVNGDQVIKL